MAIAKYNKHLTDKTINSLGSFDKALYKLRIIRLNDIMVYDALYNYGATAGFKFNWFNPLTWLFVVACLFSAITCGILGSILFEIKIIKRGIITNID